MLLLFMNGEYFTYLEILDGNCCKVEFTRLQHSRQKDYNQSEKSTQIIGTIKVFDIPTIDFWLDLYHQGAKIAK